MKWYVVVDVRDSFNRLPGWQGDIISCHKSPERAIKAAERANREFRASWGKSARCAHILVMEHRPKGKAVYR